MAEDVYVLRLEGDNYYVGYTTNPRQRIKRHFKGEGSKWTVLHPPIEVVEIVKGGLPVEWKKAIEYRKRYGKDKVRGAGWTSVQDPDQWFEQVPARKTRPRPMPDINRWINEAGGFA